MTVISRENALRKIISIAIADFLAYCTVWHQKICACMFLYYIQVISNNVPTHVETMKTYAVHSIILCVTN